MNWIGIQSFLQKTEIFVVSISQLKLWPHWQHSPEGGDEGGKKQSSMVDSSLYTTNEK